MVTRDLPQRKKDALNKLLHERDVWVATGDIQGRAHLVPFALAWDGTHVITSSETGSKTTKNIAASHQARLAIGDTRDVVLIDVAVDTVPADKIGPEIGELFAARNGWDPRKEGTGWVYFIMTPTRIIVWQNIDEMADRVLMKDGQWLID